MKSKKSMKARITISLDNMVLKNIDIKRGLVPRSPYINSILKNKKRRK